jgi:hypothetical protein
MLIAALFAFAFGCSHSFGTSGDEATTLDGRALDPLATTRVATVLVFVATDCPLSNRYAPDLARMHEKYMSRGVEFFLVYASSETAPVIAQHVRDYALPMTALRDPKHHLVALAGVHSTPEVAVFSPHAHLVYRGRIDDRQVQFGVARSEPTKRDLEEILDRLVAGQAPSNLIETPAVGCAIPAR